MTIGRERLVKNTSVLMISRVTTWGLTLLLTFYLPRYLGVENLGKLHLAGSIWAIGIILATFGMDTYLTKELAKDPAQIKNLLTQSILARGVLFLVVIVGLWIYLIFANYAQDTVYIILIIGLATLINLFNAGFYAAIMGLEKMEYVAFSDISSKILITVAAFTAVLVGAGIEAIAWLDVFGAIVSFIILVVALKLLNPVRLLPRAPLQNPKWILGASLSFFLLHVFINLYQQVDIIIISLVVDEKGVGWYSVADRLMGTLMFIPVVFMTVFFPTFSRLQSESPETLQKLMSKVFNIMVLLGVAVGFGVFIIAGPIVQLIFGSEYQNSGPILGVRGITVVFTYLNTILGIYLIAINRQKPWIAVIALATLLTIPLDFLLVPYFQNMNNNGALGGAFSYAITEFGMVIAAIMMLPKKTLTRENLFYALRVFIAGLGMLIGVLWLNPSILAIQIFLGMTFFTIFAILLRLISFDEWQIIKNGAFRMLGRFQKKPVV